MAKKYAENLSKEKGVSLISIFSASWMSDERLPDIFFIEGKQIEQSMTWAKFKSLLVNSTNKGATKVSIGQ